MSDDINKAYVSPIDKFLREFDRDHQLSASQEREIAKHARIFALRDHKASKEELEKMWGGF